MTGVGELVREGRRVGGDAALVGVGGADDGDLEGGDGVTGGSPRRSVEWLTRAGERGIPNVVRHTPSLERTTRSDSRASVPIMIPVTMSSTVLAGK